MESEVKPKVKASAALLKSARTFLGLEQEELARASGISRPTLSKLEAGNFASFESTREAVQTALENRGIVFTNGDSPGFRFEEKRAIIPR